MTSGPAYVTKETADMSISFKKILLAGTALVAVAVVSTQSEATSPRVMTASGTWASSGACNTGNTAIADACSGDAVTMNGAFTLTVTNNGTADDGGLANDFNLGAVTNTTSTGNISITDNVGGGANENVTIDSAVMNGAF